MYVAIDTNAILPGQVGGIENYTLGLIEALKRPDSPARRLLLLTRAENDALFRRFADAGTEVLLIERPTHQSTPVNNWAALVEKQMVDAGGALERFQHRKAEILHQHQVDLIHFPGNTINPINLDIPVVLNLHDLQHRHFPEYFTPAEIANREKWWVQSAHRANALIAASDFIRDDLHRQLRIDPDKVFVTPDIFESSFVNRPDARQLEDLRARLQIPATFFIYPAAAWPHKNHERLIRAFASARIPDSQLLLTGGGQETSPLPRLIESLGMQNRVRLLGRVSSEDLLGLYHLATALIFPSQFESWSIPIMEAMACGCPVATSNVTSLPQEIGDAGLLFSPEDIAGMSRAMRRLAEDTELRQTFRERGFARVKNFGPQSFLRTVAQAYRFACHAFKAREAA